MALDGSYYIPVTVYDSVAELQSGTVEPQI